MPSLQGVFERTNNILLHRRQHVRVGVDGDGYGGVPEHLGYDLGADIMGEQQCGAGVPEVVEAGGGR